MGKELQKMFKLKKQLTTTVFLRSPKHFNIGKHKLINLNFKVVNLKIRPNTVIPTTTLLAPSSQTFSTFFKPLMVNTTILPKSVKVTVVTSFKLIWLEF